MPQADGSILLGSFGGISVNVGVPNCPGNNVNPGINDRVAALPFGNGCCWVSTWPYMITVIKTADKRLRKVK